MQAEIIYLGSMKLSPPIESIKAKTLKLLGKATERLKVPQIEWLRFDAVIRKAEGAGSVLDVGVGRGHFLNALAEIGGYSRVVGTDIRAHSLFRTFDDTVECYAMDVQDLEFDDKEFDEVFCLEVLSHLTCEQSDHALKQLRRVARKKLVLSVPFCQAVPLPKGHRQRFLPEDIIRLFPQASFTMLIKGGDRGHPSLLIEERY